MGWTPNTAALYNSWHSFRIVITYSDMYWAKLSSLLHCMSPAALVKLPGSSFSKTLQTWLTNSGFPAVRDRAKPSWLRYYNYFGIATIYVAFNMESFHTLWVRNYILVQVHLCLWHLESVENFDPVARRNRCLFKLNTFIFYCQILLMCQYRLTCHHVCSRPK